MLITKKAASEKYFAEISIANSNKNLLGPLTYLIPLVSFYNTRKHTENRGFLFSESIERDR